MCGRIIFICTSLLLLLSSFHRNDNFVRALLDENGDTYTIQECISWSSIGECDNNPTWMLKHCRKQCDEVKKKKLSKMEKSSYGDDEEEDTELAQIKSFYDLKANDIDGNMLEFTKFKGKVIVITNVASYCGYTDQHYRELITLYKKFQDTQKFEIVAFPCNQFGEQEPEQCTAIKEFTNELGVKFQMMYKINVNGPNTHLVYRYLKNVAEGSPQTIEWNFATYYVINADGTSISAFSGISPMRLQSKVKSLIKMAEDTTTPTTTTSEL